METWVGSVQAGDMNQTPTSAGQSLLSSAFDAATLASHFQDPGRFRAGQRWTTGGPAAGKHSTANHRTVRNTNELSKPLCDPSRRTGFPNTKKFPPRHPSSDRNLNHNSSIRVPPGRILSTFVGEAMYLSHKSPFWLPHTLSPGSVD